MYCEECGAKLAEEAAYCEECGKKVEAEGSLETDTPLSGPAETPPMIPVPSRAEERLPKWDAYPFREATVNEAERLQLKKYFAPFPQWTIWLMVVGFFLLPAYGLGLIPIGIGIWGLVSWSRKPSDEQVNAWIEEDLKKLQPKALERTGTDESELVSEPVLVYGPRFWNIEGADVGIRKGKDGIVRFMPLGITVINFTQNQLIAYQCAWDLTTSTPLHESTDEYFYRDVVSVSTQSRSVSWDQAALNMKELAKGPLKALVRAGKLQLNAAELFVLTTSGGTSIEVVLRDPQLIERAGGGTIPTTMAEKAVQTVRKMLREKKAAPTA